jgi:hypothetical protein
VIDTVDAAGGWARTLTTAVVEASAVAGAAVSGNTALFEAWWVFAEGKATGFIVLALAVAVIDGDDARTSHAATPAWAAWIAVVAGMAAFAGWVFGMWLGIRQGNLIWLASSLVMSLWIVWFGLSLLRMGRALPRGEPGYDTVGEFDETTAGAVGGAVG